MLHAHNKHKLIRNISKNVSVSSAPYIGRNVLLIYAIDALLKQCKTLHHVRNLQHQE